MAKLASPTLNRHEVIGLCIRHCVPVQSAEGILNYFLHRIEPGGFLYAVLCNDLKAACLAADETNRHHIYDYICLLHAEAPADRYGSVSRVEAWLSGEEVES